MKLTRWIVLAAALLTPVWLLTTGAGLRAVLRITEALAGERLTFGASEGALAGNITVRDIVYSTDTVKVHIGQATLRLRLTRLALGRVQAESLEVRTLEITTRRAADPTPAGKPLTVSMPLRIVVEQGALHDFRLKLDEAREWLMPEAQFAARWRGEWITIERLNAQTLEAGAVELRGRLSIAESRLRFENFEAQSVHGSLAIDGALALADADSDLSLAWKNLRLPLRQAQVRASSDPFEMRPPPRQAQVRASSDPFEMRPPGAPWLASPQGELKLKGPWRDYGWMLEGDLRALDTPGTLRASGRGDLQELRLQQSLLKTLEGSVEGEGRFRFRDGARAELALRWQQVNPGARFKDWPGQLTGNGTFSGEWADGAPRIEFQAGLEDSRLRGYPLTLRVTGNSAEQQVFLRELALQSGASSLTATGALWPQFALTGELRSTDLRSLWTGLQGRAQMQARLRGTMQAPELELLGSGSQLAFGRTLAARAELAARLAPQGASDLRLQLDDVSVGVPPRRAQVPGTILEWPRPLRSVLLTAAGTRGKHGAQLEARGEHASGGFALGGGLAGQAWRGALTHARFKPGEGDEWLLEEPAALGFVNGRLSVDPVCLAGGESRTCWQLQASAARQHLAFRTRKFDLKHLRALLPGEWVINGDLSGTASMTLVNGELHDLRADLAGSAGSLEGGGVKLVYGPGEFQVQPDGKKLLARLRLTPAGGAVSGELTLGPAAAATLLDRRIEGQIALRLPDLAWLPVLSPEIADAQGALEGDLKVAGTLRSPSLNGRVAVSGGRVLLATPGIEFTGISASFESTARAPLALSVKAKAGEGWLQLDGELQALRPQLTGKFTLTGNNAQLLNTADIRAWATPDLQFTLARGAARLTGDVTVTGALITPRELGGGGIAPSADQMLVSEDPAAARDALRIETEVRIVLGQAVRFDGLGLKTRLTGAITAFDDPGRPTRARGELQLVGGRYRAYGQDLQIESGRLLFSGGPVTEPTMDISAYRKPREGILVGLRARGTLAAPNITLYSEPAMSQEEQLSWLVLGNSLSETLEGGQGAELAGAAMALGLTGGDSMAQRFGFDQITLGARPGETAEKARISIGKYLSPKLFVSYGVGLFQPGNYFRLQYELGRGFKLSGEAGVTSGGDLLYSIER